MESPRGVGAFVRGLEDVVEKELRGRERVALAYSGGLASTLVATVARKRCDLQCIVAGVDRAPDVEAAKAAKAHLDSRMEFVLLSSDETRRIQERLAATDDRLSAHDVEALVAIHAVLARIRSGLVMSGFGAPQLSTPMASALRRANVSTPLHTATRGRTLSRGTLRAAATLLGLPPTWVRAPHRAPATGAGIEDFLHEPQHDVR